MSDFAWLRNKSPEHMARINAKRAGNQNAKKHGLYSRTPPTASCDTCPNTRTCPLFKPGNLCAYAVADLQKGIERTEKKSRKSRYFKSDTPGTGVNLGKN